MWFSLFPIRVIKTAGSGGFFVILSQQAASKRSRRENRRETGSWGQQTCMETNKSLPYKETVYK
ncbi:hypothetical protein CO251_11205 [Sulfobacillus sp. hq2]|nr:hypothetical protein CO251_11205 [Sulfobacillus sp. hq2]